jgi:hypothetical protein
VDLFVMFMVLGMVCPESLRDVYGVGDGVS